jgi:serine/threonine-protein kinase
MSDESRPEELDGALHAAYRRKATRGDSILAAIEALTGPVPRILLRDVPGDSPVLRPGTDEADRAPERYQVVGEIARGGIGIVMKSRDTDLGRDVAMKVLHDRHARSPEVLQRFVEEAQIGGQLQHPGIVPVYELGLNADRTPYFTMKLVKGKTLAALLAERDDPREERPRFLTIFVQVCQTMAYAHARGVIHRDLKPANIMVGAFGEVQVVDWGLAKILSTGGVADEERTRADAAERDLSRIRTVRVGSEDSASQIGSVLGTPAYMSPEQALGQIDALDTRSDVFGLGAILLEILTGRPPYVTESGNLLVQAAQSELTEAFEHLERSDADPVLVALTKRCLSRGQPQRPHDASRLAAEVTAHLHAVEERTRTAEVEGARAEVRALEERKARKLTLGLAAAVLLAVVLGGGGLYWVEAKERSRLEQVEGIVRDAVDEARGLEGEARKARDLWPRALEAADRAVSLAAEHDAGEEVAASAESLRERIHVEALRAETNEKLLGVLSGIRATRGDRLDLKAADEAYSAAFTRFGIEGDRALESVIEELKATGIPEELAAYLDEWIWLRGIVDRPRDRILSIAEAVDPHPWRNRLRRAVGRRPHGDLTMLAANPDLTGNSPNLLARWLSDVERRNEAVDVLRRAQRERPEDFWLNYDLGWELTMLVPPRWEEAMGFFRVALARRPDSREVRHQLGIALLKLDRADEAVEVFEDALARHPDHVHFYDHLIEAHEARGDLRSLAARWSAQAATKPDRALGHYLAGRALQACGDVEGMRSAYDAAVAADPETALYRECLAFAHLYAGETEKGLRVARRALEEHPDHAGLHHAVAYALWLEDDIPGLLAAVDAGLKLNPYHPFLLDMKGQILAEEGQYEEAEASHRRAFSIYPDHAATRLTMGWLCDTRNDIDGAIEVLEEGTRLPERFAEGRFLHGVEETLDVATGRRSRRMVLRPWMVKESIWNLLGRMQRLRGRWREASRSFEQGLKTNPAATFLRSNLADTLHVLGEPDRSARHYELILEERDDAYSRYFLAFAHLAQGRIDEAERHFRIFAAHRLMREAREERRAGWARDLPEALRLMRDLPAILEGTRSWASARERALAAWALEDMGYGRLPARLFEEAFAEDPAIAGQAVPWVAIWHYAGYATIAAMTASLGLGVDGDEIPEAERARWRRKALEWIRLDLEMWRLRNDPEEEARQLREWRTGPHYRRFSIEQNLAEFPPEEAEAWRSVWKTVADRLEWLESRGR